MVWRKLDANCKIFEQYDDGSGTTSTTLEDGQELSRIEPQEAIARDTTFTVFDELGGRHQVRIAFIKTAPNVWNVCVIDDEGKIQGDPHEIEFDSSTGKLINGDTLDLEVYADETADPALKLPNGATPFKFRIDLSEITQFENTSDASAKALSDIRRSF